MDRSSPNESKVDRERLMLLWTKRLAIFTGALFLATMISDVIVGVDFLEKKTAQANTEEQLRAFLSVQSIVQIRGYNLQTKTFGPAFSVAIQNVGGTRTAWASANVSAKYFAKEVPTGLDLSKPYLTVASHKTVIGPQGIIPMAPVGVSDKEVDDTKSGEGVILVWGNVEYSTIYHPSTTLKMRFCFLMNAFTPPKTPIQDSIPEISRPKELALQPMPFQDTCNSNE